MIKLDWGVVKETLADALELQAERREHFLRTRCGGDEHLRSTVARLLREHDSAAGFLDESPSAAPATPHGDAPPAPTRIGPYLLQERLGEGGFGVVYRATQTVPFEREVAVKLLKSGAHANAVAERFRVERDALARMDHEDICRVLDAGVTAEGCPFVVMDLVRGRPIGAFCDELRLALRERVALMIRTARAVHHAHQRAVIHCDVKPSNILVSQHAGVTRVRLIDFGIARAVDEAGQTGRTRSDLAGTPRYMSPERRTANGAADVRSDIYSLGSVLAELLEAARHHGLARPSSLARDVAAIAAKATADQPSLRYDSAAALADDLDRALAGKSILAMPEGAGATALRMARRNPVGTLLATIAACSIIAGTVAAWMGRATALEARDEADREARRAELVARFLLDDMLGSLDPDEAKGRDVTVAELLTRVDERMRQSLGEDPLLLADVAAMLGTAYRHIGREEQAIEALELAIATRERTDPRAAADLLSWRAQLVQALHGVPGRSAEAMELRARNAADAIAWLGPWHPVAMRARLQHAPDAIPLDERSRDLEQMLDRAAAMHADDPALEEEILQDLSRLYGEMGRSAEAIAALERAVAVAEARVGRSHSSAIVLSKTLADLLFRHGAHDRANAVYDDVVARTRAMVPPGHPAITGIVSTVAMRKIAMDRAAEAVPLAEEVRDAAARVNGEQSIQHVSARLTLGQALVGSGRFEEALAVLAPLVELTEGQWGPRHAQTARVRLAVARAQHGLLDHTAALDLCEQVAAAQPITNEPGLSALELRHRILLALDREREAEDLATAAMASLPEGAPSATRSRVEALSQRGAEPAGSAP